MSRVRSTVLSGEVAAVLVLTLAVCAAAEEPALPTCFFETFPDTTFPRTTGITIDSLGTFDALLIFARFPDGEEIDSNGNSLPLCSGCSDDHWAPADSLPPAWASDSLIDASATSPTPGSITHFFDTWSQGKHALIGTVLDTVLVCDYSIVEIDTSSGFPSLTEANTNILAKADSALGGFAAADLTGDGVIDFVFLHYQSGRALDSAGGYHTLNPGFTASLGLPSYTSTDGTTAGGTNGGACHFPFIRPVAGTTTLVQHRWYTMALMAHEYGHVLQRLANFNQFANEHVSSLSRYAIMHGTFPTGLQMSGIFRYKLNWIDPQIVAADSLPTSTTLTLSASYLDHDASFALVKPDTSLLGNSPQYFLLEAKRDSLSGHLYGSEQPGGSCCFRTLDNDRGLLVTHVADSSLYLGHWPIIGSKPPPVADIELATGSFDTTDASPDPIAGLNNLRNNENISLGGHSAREWDLFEPQEPGDRVRSNAFTPYTNPNTNLYDDGRTLSTNTWHQTTYSGISIFNIEWTSAAQESIRMDIRFDDITQPPADTVAADTKWQGLVQLTGDLVVKEGVTLTVADDALIVASALKDRHAAGQDTTVQLLSRGQVLFQGADSTITLTSSRDDTFEHWQIVRDSCLVGAGTFLCLVPPDTTTRHIKKNLDDYRYKGEVAPPAAGDWRGVGLENLVAVRAGYGYTGVVEAMSEIEDTEVRYGEAGIAIRGQAAPSLSGLSFDSITGDRHILLDSTDVFVPYAVRWDSCAWDTCWTETPTVWDLDGGTHVVARNGVRAGQDASVGVTGKTDLVVGGKVFARGASGDTVYFRPETETANADDWGGITIDNGYAKGGVIEYADISYAENPLFVFYPDSLWALRHSRIHHFAETGLWVKGAVGQGGVVESNTIERGSGLLLSLGRTGLLLDQADEMRILDNKIDLSGLQVQGSTTYPVHAYFGPSYCGTSPAESDSLVLDGNWIIGPGTSGSIGNHSGIYFDYLCGGSQRRVYAANNYVEQLNVAGLTFRESADVQVDCNTVLDNLRAVDIARDSTTTGGSMRFWKNWLDVKDGLSGLEVVRTDNRANTVLGMATPLTNRGNNGLMAEDALVEFVLSNDPKSLGTPPAPIDARNNYWYTYNTSTQVEELLDTTFEVFMKLKPKLKPSAAHVDYSSYYQSDSTKNYCRQTSDPGVGGAYAGTQDGVSEPRQREPSGLVLSGLAPAETFLDPPAPSPSRGAVVLSFGVAAGTEGPFVVEVFDVTGRRVRTVLDGPLTPGRYRIGWRGEDAAGRRVSSGIYFVRMRGPGFAKTEKVTIVR